MKAIIEFNLPEDRDEMLKFIKTALKSNEKSFRKPYIGTQ